MRGIIARMRGIARMVSGGHSGAWLRVPVRLGIGLGSARAAATAWGHWHGVSEHHDQRHRLGRPGVCSLGRSRRKGANILRPRSSRDNKSIRWKRWRELACARAGVWYRQSVLVAKVSWSVNQGLIIYEYLSSNNCKSNKILFCNFWSLFIQII